MIFKSYSEIYFVIYMEIMANDRISGIMLKWSAEDKIRKVKPIKTG